MVTKCLQQYYIWHNDMPGGIDAGGTYMPSKVWSLEISNKLDSEHLYLCIGL